MSWDISLFSKVFGPTRTVWDLTLLGGSLANGSGEGVRREVREAERARDEGRRAGSAVRRKPKHWAYGE